MTLCPKTSAGEISHQADLKSKVKVLTTPAEDVTNVIISEKEDGNLGLKFTPNVPGDYIIDMKVNNEKLSTCPLTVLVKERELAVVGELDLNFLQGDLPHRLFGIAVDTQGNIAVTDKGACRIYVFNNEGVCRKNIRRSKGANSGVFSLPSGVSYLKDNEILVADQLNCKIQHLDIQTGTILNNFGKRGTGKGEFNCPIDVSLGDKGCFVVTEYNNRRIQIMTQDGKTTTMFGDSGPEKLNKPISCIAYRNRFFVSDAGNNCIKVFDQSGTFLYKFGIRGSEDGDLENPYGISVDSSKNLLVCDRNNNRVQQFSLDGLFTGKTITDIASPTGIATAPDGRILVTSATTNKVYILK